MFEDTLCVCTFGGTLFTVVMSWLTFDGLCCGKRQDSYLAKSFDREGYLAYLGQEEQKECTILCTRLIIF